MSAILEGRVALVTGVSHDGQVGQVVGKALAEHGTALAICARTQTNVEAICPTVGQRFERGPLLGNRGEGIE